MTVAPEGELRLIRTASVCTSTSPLRAMRRQRVRAWWLHHGSRLCVNMDFGDLLHTPAPGVAQLESELDWAALTRTCAHGTHLNRAVPLTGSPHAPQICVKMDFGSTPHTPAPGDGHLESELDWTAHTRPCTIVTCPDRAPLTRLTSLFDPCAPQAQANRWRRACAARIATHSGKREGGARAGGSAGLDTNHRRLRRECRCCRQRVAPGGIAHAEGA